MKTNQEAKAVKIELRYIAPYLPYALTMYAPYGFRPNGKESTGTHRVVYLTGDLYADLENNIYQGEVFKPILRPMSDLDDWLYFSTFKNLKPDYITDGYFDKLWKMVNTIFSSPESSPYWFIELLLVNHFDVFGLIPAGLAIDMNSLPTKGGSDGNV